MVTIFSQQQNIRKFEWPQTDKKTAYEGIYVHITSQTFMFSLKPGQFPDAIALISRKTLLKKYISDLFSFKLQLLNYYHLAQAYLCNEMCRIINKSVTLNPVQARLFYRLKVQGGGSLGTPL